MTLIKMRNWVLGAVVILAVSVKLYNRLTPTSEASSVAKNWYVSDTEKLFSTEQSKQLEEYHKFLLERYDIDLRVFTGQFSPEQAVSFFKTAKIGENSKTRKGMLLLIDSKNDQVRLEISAGLDAVYTDGFVAYIQQRQMIPFFQANQVTTGILATTEMIITRAQEAISGKAFVPPEQLPQNLAIGAGAQTAASIGTGYQPQELSNSTATIPQDATPEDIVALYLKSLENKNHAYNLPIYSLATQDFFQKRVVTQAQMQNSLNSYKKCPIDKVIFIKDKTLAVVRYSIDEPIQRKCAPYYLVMENGAWKLDFVTMSRTILFDFSNYWGFNTKQSNPYADAFTDWEVNENGYPFPIPKLRWGIMTTNDKKQNIVYIEKIFPNSPAANMALQENDIILSWDEIESPSQKQIADSMNSVEDGKIIKVQIWRNGQKMLLDLKAPPKIQN